ncbi:hypothetical protein GBA65_20335 [Rubrobacter marinus]|uniref:Uncharacterized protein n=1 Tax=Rubrobacter marinus TaxID=2653852 RepID=A0A6G8Q2D5_9ACTN|nr:hypothetical protein [Rubrobacter marinus]QIN80477.1 hypothetical protein GBA65_20335 [Rubrobacter marinus]
MPVRERRPEDEKPLFRAVNDRRLIRPVSEEQAGTAQAEQEQPSAAAGQTAPQSGAGQSGQGPIARGLDRAEENNWVYGSVANALRQSGLVARADDLLSRLNGG